MNFLRVSLQRSMNFHRDVLLVRKMNFLCKSNGNKPNVSLSSIGRETSESNSNKPNDSLRIAKHLFSKQLDKNIVFSPLPLQVILGIIANGSEGCTQHQLLSFLRSESTNHLNSFYSKLVSIIFKDAAPAGGPHISLTNSMSIQRSLSLYLRSSFKKIMSTDFKATLDAIDLENKASIIFANEVYFKGAWKERFIDCMKKDYDFHLLNGSSVKVPFMTNFGDQFIEVFNDFKVLRLPYEQGKDKRQFSMYIFLPNAKDGLPALVEKVELLQHRLPFTKVEVGDFGIPKFKFSFELETSRMLKELGVILPFSHGGLTNMVDSPASQDLYVSNIVQKSFIEVNEKGTEAAAVTVSDIEQCFCSLEVPTPQINFVADHPFLFLIREDLTGTILFVGQVLDPLPERC